MPNPCNICSEPGVKDSVDRQLRDGISIRVIAKAVARSKSSVARHKLHGNQQGAAEKPAAKCQRSGRRNTSQTRRDTGRAAKPIKTLDDLCAEFQDSLDEARSIAAEARERNDLRSQLVAVEKRLAVATKIGNALGLLASDGTTTINIDARRQTAAMIDREFSVEEARQLLATMESLAPDCTLSSGSVRKPMPTVADNRELSRAASIEQEP